MTKHIPPSLRKPSMYGLEFLEPSVMKYFTKNYYLKDFPTKQLTDLPPKIWFRIFSYIEPSDIKKFRLAVPKRHRLMNRLFGHDTGQHIDGVQTHIISLLYNRESPPREFHSRRAGLIASGNCHFHQIDVSLNDLKEEVKYQGVINQMKALREMLDTKYLYERDKGNSEQSTAYSKVFIIFEIAFAMCATSIYEQLEIYPCIYKIISPIRHRIEIINSHDEDPWVLSKSRTSGKHCSLRLFELSGFPMILEQPSYNPINLRGLDVCLSVASPSLVDRSKQSDGVPSFIRTCTFFQGIGPELRRHILEENSSLVDISIVVYLSKTVKKQLDLILSSACDKEPNLVRFEEVHFRKMVQGVILEYKDVLKELCQLLGTSPKDHKDSQSCADRFLQALFDGSYEWSAKIQRDSSSVRRAQEAYVKLLYSMIAYYLHKLVLSRHGDSSAVNWGNLKSQNLFLRLGLLGSNHMVEDKIDLFTKRHEVNKKEILTEVLEYFMAELQISTEIESTQPKNWNLNQFFNNSEVVSSADKRYTKIDHPSSLLKLTTIVEDLKAFICDPKPGKYSSSSEISEHANQFDITTIDTSIWGNIQDSHFHASPVVPKKFKGAVFKDSWQPDIGSRKPRDNYDFVSSSLAVKFDDHVQKLLDCSLEEDSDDELERSNLYVSSMEYSHSKHLQRPSWAQAVAAGYKND